MSGYWSRHTRLQDEVALGQKTDGRHRPAGTTALAVSGSTGHYEPADGRPTTRFESGLHQLWHIEELLCRPLLHRLIASSWFRLAGW